MAPLVTTAEKASAAYRIWAETYDYTPNALLALEMRVLAARIGPVSGMRILDAGAGTGRWMAWAHAHGASIFGVDASREMIVQAAQKPGLSGRAALADVQRIPVRDDAADIAVCSFTVGYLEFPELLFDELARVARRVIVSDLHPEAVRHGWTRSFRAAGRRYEVEHYDHSAARLDVAARAAGLQSDWREDLCFDEPERHIFTAAGKERAFEDVRSIPAVLIAAWTR